ncbi:hypothetical protein P700755_002493 [Psychroflexus torquis ATCC 700755]|uniref:Lipoprotein n=1 Tax=Psychroflexus torquis (strain ATCC 700755 / CIP 106069 / ACAM 623) TaxID=313595 RepID=K4IFU7_PSYTT|nr:hypothetical protein [Psychroflexus torquis]AFU69254.1 hypothetical protein P700755_002493 [Psychroflexus torquis ATCC 700755]
MNYYFQIYKKSCITLLAVLATLCMFSKDHESLFIQEDSQITGLDRIHSSPYLAFSQGIIYVKDNAVFYSSEKTTTAKVVYFSGIKTPPKKKKQPNTSNHSELSAKKQSTQFIYTIAPQGKFPLQGGVFSNYNYCIATATTNIFKKNKPSSFTTKYTYPTKGDLVYAVICSKGISHTYPYGTPHHKIAVLRSYYSLPPPIT